MSNPHLDPPERHSHIQSLVVTAHQMAAIEARVFAAGMPVEALMEKVAGLIFRRIQAGYPKTQYPYVGVLVGPWHNGGDALVVARELQFQGYHLVLYQPLTQQKDLTRCHAAYAQSLGIPIVDTIESLQTCDLIIDGLFGFGLTRAITGTIAEAIAHLNSGSIPIVSIDLPSGLHTDTGEVLGTAIRARQTLCLGLWKLACLQDQALEYLGQVELIDFNLPLADIAAILGDSPPLRRITRGEAIATLPLSRHPTTHKYQQGHLLLICGSRQYSGAALLSGLAARASGVGMLSIAVPESLKLTVVSQVPDALVIGCPETDQGAIAQLPSEIDLESYQAIACGPGLTLQARAVVNQVLESNRPLVLDADGLNILASMESGSTQLHRMAPTILTPHPGEFRRLFFDVVDSMGDRTTAVRLAAEHSQAIVVLKGARVAIAYPDGIVWVNPDSTPALARGGSGDVLTGLMGGLIAQANLDTAQIHDAVKATTWWHAQAGIWASQHRTELGVDACTLTDYLIPALKAIQEGVQI